MLNRGRLDGVWVLFDLDGTLTKSEEGIWNGIRYTMGKMGRPEPDAETLWKCIGPPLIYSFQEYMGLSEEEAWKAMRYYQEITLLPSEEIPLPFVSVINSPR